ncbi:hypothetical protein C5B85_17260 [Pseudoclavibacter sp. AY1F1]|nr:hypothetical protein C5B85_17260 [Pseudoclavibacter sp. AY1F1]
MALAGAAASVGNVGVSFATTLVGGAYALNAANLRLATPTVAGGATGTNARLALQQTSSASTTTPRGQATTISFDRPVQNLSFTIYGFTRSTATYNDAAYITSAATFTRSGQGSQIAGVGTSVSPWTTNTVNSESGQTTTANSVTVTFVGPVSSLVINYYSAGGSGGAQAIFLGNMAFTAGC